MTYLHFLGLHVDVGGIVSEKYLPEPAMGNMKPDSPTYAEKFAEKLARVREEAQHDPVLAIPSRVRIWFFKALAGGMESRDAFELDPKDKQEKAVYTWDQREKLYEFLCTLPSVAVFGLHPTTHTRILANQWVRMRRPVPKCQQQGNYAVVNPWRELGTNLEYPAAADALEINSVDPLQASWELIRRLGVPSSCQI